MNSHLAEIVTNPNVFLRKEADAASYRSALVVLFVSLINAASSLYLVRRMTFEDVPEISETVFGVVGFFGVLFGVVGVFASWLVYAAVFYVLTHFTGGSGSFRTLFWLTGWGYLPALLTAIVSLISTVYVLSMMPESLPAEELLDQYQTHPVHTTAGFIGVFTLIWQWLIWTFVVHHSRNIALTKASIIVAIPVGINIAWSVSQLL